MQMIFCGNSSANVPSYVVVQAADTVLDWSV